MASTPGKISSVVWNLVFKNTKTKKCLYNVQSTCLSSHRYASHSSFSGSVKPEYSSKKVNLVTPLFIQAEKFADNVAVVDEHGWHTYSKLLHFSNALTDRIGDIFNEHLKIKDELKGKRIALLCPNNISYVVAQWATWMSGGVVVPLSKTYPPTELQYFIEDSKSELVITTEEYIDQIRPAANNVGIPLLELKKGDYLSDYGEYSTDIEENIQLDGLSNSLNSENCVEDVDQERHQNRTNRHHQRHMYNKFKYVNSLIIYTSGTTGRPKGVVHTHGSIQAQIDGMIKAWGWTPRDVILHVLPLHHVHGVVNVLMTPLYCGATCIMMPNFDARKVWSMLVSPKPGSLPHHITVFMAVPTVYAKLIADYEDRLQRGRGTKQAKEYIKAVCKSKIRLMVCGSAALPEPVMRRWEEITSHKLLERYGMTEIGMALTNPLHGKRTPGAVGHPFPSVDVCITKPNVYSEMGYEIIAQGNSNRTKVTAGHYGEEGDLMVRGPSVFTHYWAKEDATAEVFTTDGWFKTGDTACYKDGVFWILGRTSVDIIKSGGYKISALDIERHLLEHADITDVAVVGLPDITWGQKVAAIVVQRTDSEELTLDQLGLFCQDKMPSYQMPSVLRLLDAMPRNDMGKVNKKELLNTVFEKEMKTIR